MAEAILLSKFITGEKDAPEFYELFKGKYSDGFSTEKDLQRIGVVNQTTMLASDTQAISDFLKNSMQQKYGLDKNTIEERFADTKDTLCYATNDNQTAVTGLLEIEADFALVVGGYNSSNTSHLVELCEEKLPTYFINSAEKIISSTQIKHFNFNTSTEEYTTNFIPRKTPVKILITSGASCPDALVEGVIEKLATYFTIKNSIEDLAKTFQ